MIRLFRMFFTVFLFFTFFNLAIGEDLQNQPPTPQNLPVGGPEANIPPYLMPNMPLGPDTNQMPPPAEYTEEPLNPGYASEEPPPVTTQSQKTIITPYNPIVAVKKETTGNPDVLSKKEAPAATNTKIASGGVDNKISLDLKGVEVVDVLKMLASRSNLNIVVGKNVRGKVTIFLKDVDLWDAFEIMLASNELAYDRRGDIINVMTERDYELIYGEKYNNKTKVKIIKLEYAKASEIAKFLNQLKTRVGKIIADDISGTVVIIDSPQAVLDMEDMVSKFDTPVETRVFSLNYAKAEDLKGKITELLTKGSGILQVDERTNTIVVTDTVKKLEDVSGVINAFDEKHKEVLIDAEILEISLSDEFKAGIDWEKVLQKYHGLTLRSVFNLVAAGGAGPIGELAVGTLTGDGYTLLVQLLETIGKTKTLSRPRIAALNNQEAKILVGTKQPYTTETVVTPGTGASTTATNVTFVDVGIKLYVTPTINDEGFVTMKIKPEVSSASKDPYVTTASVKIPIVNTSEAETTVMVKDGTTIVIGGLMKDIDEKSINQIPFLGDIPIVGNLFKKVDNTVTKAEIVIFLTPHIITGDRENIQLSGLDDKVKMSKKPYTKEETVYMTKVPVNPDRKLLEVPQPEPQVVEKIVEKSVTKEVIKEVPRVVTREVPIPTSSSLSKTGSSYGYYEFVRNKVMRHSRVNSPEGALKGDVKVYFNVASDGTLIGEPKVLSNTDKRLNSLAKENVIESAPFPPFPKSLEKDSEGFTLTISYE